MGTAAAEPSMARPSAQTIRRAWLMSPQLHQDLPRPGDKVLPDRAQLTMTVSFMRAYTERLVQVCHHTAHTLLDHLVLGDSEEFLTLCGATMLDQQS